MTRIVPFVLLAALFSGCTQPAPAPSASIAQIVGEDHITRRETETLLLPGLEGAVVEEGRPAGWRTRLDFRLQGDDLSLTKPDRHTPGGGSEWRLAVPELNLSLHARFFHFDQLGNRPAQWAVRVGDVDTCGESSPDYLSAGPVPYTWDLDWGN